ncbi:MAG: BrnT family toxin [Verrucomicrobia bacterium]|nr:BrnT family toxin [Verrucomicrobiota bacterium]
MQSGFSQIDGFEWDEGNRDKNRQKHKVSTGECEEIFFNQPLIILDDPAHSKNETRYAAYGVTNEGRTLMVYFTVRKTKYRVISARDMHRKERRFYEDQP